MVAASGTRFDGLDLLAIFIIPGILVVIMWLVYRVQGPLGGKREDDFDLIKAREQAKLGLETGGLIHLPEPTQKQGYGILNRSIFDPDDPNSKHLTFSNDPPYHFTVLKNGVVIQNRPMKIESVPLGFFPDDTFTAEMFDSPEEGETKYLGGRKVFDWKQSPPFTDWDRDEPACW